MVRKEDEHQEGDTPEEFLEQDQPEIDAELAVTGESEKVTTEEVTAWIRQLHLLTGSTDPDRNPQSVYASVQRAVATRYTTTSKPGLQLNLAELEAFCVQSDRILRSKHARIKERHRAAVLLLARQLPALEILQQTLETEKLPTTDEVKLQELIDVIGDSFLRFSNTARRIQLLTQAAKKYPLFSAVEEGGWMPLALRQLKTPSMKAEISMMYGRIASYGHLFLYYLPQLDLPTSTHQFLRLQIKQLRDLAATMANLLENYRQHIGEINPASTIPAELTSEAVDIFEQLLTGETL